MGHQIEYFASVPEHTARWWLDRLDGFSCSDPGDEYLLGQWHQAVGREWEDLPGPVEELRSWLQSRDSHWDWLVPGTSN